MSLLRLVITGQKNINKETSDYLNNLRLIIVFIFSFILGVSYLVRTTIRIIVSEPTAWTPFLYTIAVLLTIFSSIGLYARIEERKRLMRIILPPLACGYFVFILTFVNALSDFNGKTTVFECASAITIGIFCMLVVSSKYYEIGNYDKQAKEIDSFAPQVEEWDFEETELWKNIDNK